MTAELNVTERTKLAAIAYVAMPDRRANAGGATNGSPGGRRSSRDHRGKRTKIVAEQFDVSPTNLHRAAMVYREAPELFDAIDGDELKITTAYERIRAVRAIGDRTEQHAREVKALKRVRDANGAVQKILDDQETIVAAVENHRDLEAVAALAQSVLRSEAILERIAAVAMERLTPGQRERVWALLKEGGYA
jgi:hypothetical protein